MYSLFSLQTKPIDAKLFRSFVGNLKEVQGEREEVVAVLLSSDIPESTTPKSLLFKANWRKDSIKDTE
jgi:hypothetical protein